MADTRYPTTRIKTQDLELLRGMSKALNVPMTELLSEAIRDFIYTSATR